MWMVSQGVLLCTEKKNQESCGFHISERKL